MINDSTIKKNWGYIALKYGVNKNLNPKGSVNFRDTYSNSPVYWKKFRTRRLYLPVPDSLISSAGYIDLVNETLFPASTEYQDLLLTVLADLKRLQKEYV